MALNKLFTGDIIKVIMDLTKRIKVNRYNTISIITSRILCILEYDFMPILVLFM